MGDRFYSQIKERKGFKSVAETMEFCHKPYRPNENRTKPEIEADIGIVGLSALVKEEMLWLESNILDIRGGELLNKSSKKEVVTALTEKIPEVTWNKLTLKVIKEVIKLGLTEPIS